MNLGKNADLDRNLWKVSIQRSFAPKPEAWRGSNRHLTWRRLQVKGYTAERYCLFHVVVQGPRSFRYRSTFLYDVTLLSTGHQSCPIFGFWPIFLIQNAYKVPSGDQPTAQGLHRRIIPIFPCDSRRSKGAPSGSGVFLRLLVGELWTPNLHKFSRMAKGYTHTRQTI